MVLLIMRPARYHCANEKDNRNIPEQRVSQACSTLTGQFNLLCRNFGFCSSNVLYRLFHTFCMSLYGSQLWDFSNETLMETVFVIWRKCVRFIFKVPYNTHCNLVHLIAEAPSVKVQLHRRFLKFYIGLRKSDNPLVAMMSKFVLHGSRSAACKSLNYICSLYGFCKYDVTYCDLRKVEDADAEDVVQVAGILSTFLQYREINNENAITDIIEYLCTS